MTEAYVLTLGQNAIIMALILGGPILLISLLIGSLVSLVQAATQINESTLIFIPKLIGIILVLVLLGSWMLQHAMTFTHALFTSLPESGSLICSPGSSIIMPSLSVEYSSARLQDSSPCLRMSLIS
jgi:flagellar biosynthetic protein FliQ